MPSKKPSSKKSSFKTPSSAAALHQRLSDLAANLWWSWQPEAQRLFASLDPIAWRASNHAPLVAISAAAQIRAGDGGCRLDELIADAGFLKRLAKVEELHRDYFKSSTWFDRLRKARRRAKVGAAGKGMRRMRVAYFCSEYALHESIPQYSGGLGVLAGDHLKSASDLGIPLCAVGLLYKHGYYRQEFRQDGTTRVLYPEPDFADWPLQNTGVEIECPIGSRTVRAKVWKLDVGRVPLYLLDADLPGNKPDDRKLTEGLYKGEPELRLRQQILLGVGGVKALVAVGEKPTLCHLNEGHAAFANLERMRMELEAGRSMEKGFDRLRQTSLFTTHTPVPAGHDRYEPQMVAKWLRPLMRELDLNMHGLADLGRETPGDKAEPLCMTVLALRTCGQVNGVASLHGQVSREMWKKVYGKEQSKDVPISHVTNGVHTQTWLAPEANELYAKHITPRWSGIDPAQPWWDKAKKIPDEELWALRNTLRHNLIHFVRERMSEQMLRRGATASMISDARHTLSKDALTIGFARRFATYKRAPLIFKDAARLEKLMQAKGQAVQIIFAGKAHPRDEAGQAYAQKIYKMAQKEGFRGSVAVLEEYDMHIGRMLTSGCDVWLNTPIRPHEASGTSGMKPPLHGGLNLSIADGWWPEGFNGKNGWVIDGDKWAVLQGRTRALSESGRARDEADASALYELLENVLVPLFYDRNRSGIPKKWLKLCKQSLMSIPAEFSSHRMLVDYAAMYMHEREI
ncbi:MAG: alpha-glucan family phosphorylase [Planctomycetes bacterium]|jgi:starch phosphorylase|nr:alpha-glucan family phosphorylase [Planctomycetota bacterium]MBT4027860.1 alpha-glucan family phosphorylase [Planctomycetota bacterium]MBT4559345.1 alpha-glucan family phosphorylase [Planctomycetota bacterium]MBT5102173.1 alpha-glucan family phosphorylase [Planctomycetota bacterium]MBT7011391.1 alpha-glucan family phosphorylase [Planctomycetota bacterium]